MIVWHPSGRAEHLVRGQGTEQPKSYDEGVWDRGQCNAADKTEGPSCGQVIIILKPKRCSLDLDYFFFVHEGQ